MRIWYKVLLVKLLLVFSLLKIGNFLFSIYKAYTNIQTPLILSYLTKSVTFPSFFLISVWIFVAVGCWTLLKSEVSLEKRFVLLVVLVFVFQFFEGFIYSFLMQINPYG